MPHCSIWRWTPDIRGACTRDDYQSASCESRDLCEVRRHCPGGAPGSFSRCTPFTSVTRGVLKGLRQEASPAFALSRGGAKSFGSSGSHPFLGDERGVLAPLAFVLSMRTGEEFWLCS